jgi:hypothetical protein
VRIAARGRRSAARCCWPVSPARPSGSGSTCRGDMTGSGPGSWRAHLGE